ncbi:high mobility group B protein 15-like [Magnolia sinica]|uniref:high mobility group B protein 15-like n=1 Tax=Magnolia sinica TaxID=86752 RepID=UPI00265ADFF7|nr:high mobility group B protein 15-like [Magnolia sinica]
MHENGEHLPAVDLPTVTETDGGNSSGGYSKENLDVSDDRDSVCRNSSESIAGELSQNSDTGKSVPENSEHLEFCNEPSGSGPIVQSGDSGFDAFVLYKEVTARGGFEKVTKDGRWGEVASALNLKIEAPGLFFLLQENYVYLLEQMYILTMQGELAAPFGLLPAPDLFKKNFTGQASSNQDHPSGKRKRKKNYPPPNTDNTGPHMGKIMTGMINTKINSGYLITTQLGSQKFDGLVYHVQECADVQFAIIPGLVGTVGPYSDPESCLQIQPSTPTKSKSRSGSKKAAIKKDPHAPRRIRTAYQFFLSEQLGRLKKTHPKNIRKVATDAWKSLSESERLPYIEVSQKEKGSCKQESGPDAPQRTRSAYQIFLCEKYSQLKIHQDTETTNLKMAIDAWKSLSESERLPYVEESRKDKERYEREMVAYKELQNTQSSNAEYQSCHSELSVDDCYHVSLETEQESGEFLVSDESTAQIACHLMENANLLTASQMDWDFC